MKDMIQMFTALILLVGVNGKPHSGYCIGSQCFAVFQTRTDFLTAQQHCEKQNGHLMTVRSSVSHDVISILLGSLNGDFWIGLQLPKGHCPDDASDLRGYKWVTGDNGTNFHDWGAHTNDCLSKCVSVSNVEFKWTEQLCDNEMAGFLCEYNFPNTCNPVVVSNGESVEYMTPIGFKVEEMASFPSGTTATHKPNESKYICFSDKWVRAPWHCEIDNGGCENECLSVDQNYVCICPPGKILNKNNVTCEDTKNDPCLNLGCSQECYQNNDGHASCICHHGFKLAEDGKFCTDVNHCADERQCPGDNFKCINTVGGFECRCDNGYRMEHSLCIDIDECLDFPCEHKCINTPGSYICSCYDGYIPTTQDPNKCQLHCPFEECLAECDPNDKYECNCPTGYIVDERDDMFCVDIDECDMFYCNQLCINTFGSYVCSCKAGFKLVDGFNCIEIEGTNSSELTTPFDFKKPTVVYPTYSPSVVTAGGLLGIIVGIIFVILVIVLFTYHFVKHRGALKAQGHDLHDLEQVTTEKYEQS